MLTIECPKIAPVYIDVIGTGELFLSQDSCLYQKGETICYNFLSNTWGGFNDSKKVYFKKATLQIVDLPIGDEEMSVIGSIVVSRRSSQVKFECVPIGYLFADNKELLIRSPDNIAWSFTNARTKEIDNETIVTLLSGVLHVE